MTRHQPALILQPDQPLPTAESASGELVALGGRPTPERLLEAYQGGIFPWYSEDLPPIWWSPATRAGVAPGKLHVPRRLARRMARGSDGAWRITLDRAFDRVVGECAAPRKGEDGTWITPDLQQGFVELHRRGCAHSLEVWRCGELAGGIYGLAVGRVFCAESKFHRAADASKAALVALARLLHRLGYDFLECQFLTPHLRQFGIGEIPRRRYLRLLRQGLAADAQPAPWPAPGEAQHLWRPS